MSILGRIMTASGQVCQPVPSTVSHISFGVFLVCGLAPNTRYNVEILGDDLKPIRKYPATTDDEGCLKLQNISDDVLVPRPPTRQIEDDVQE